jgi:hypothetical protein
VKWFVACGRSERCACHAVNFAKAPTVPFYSFCIPATLNHRLLGFVMRRFVQMLRCLLIRYCY